MVKIILIFVSYFFRTNLIHTFLSKYMLWQAPITFKETSVVLIKENACRIHFWSKSKDEVIDLKMGNKLKETSFRYGVFYHLDELVNIADLDFENIALV